MTVVASWRTALRVARREARRSTGRSALVVTMIALPVLALSFTAVSYDMLTLTGDERADRTMGTTDARVSWEFRAPVLQFPDGENYWPATMRAEDPRGIEQQPATEAELRAELPAGSTVHPLGRGAVELRTTDGLARTNAIAADATAPVTLGYVEVLDGRAPRTATEVALTRQAMNRLGQQVGGTVTNADGTRSYTVVGEVEFPSLLEEVVLFAPLPEIRTALGLQQEWLVDTPAPVTWAQVRELNQSGIVVASRDVFLHPPPADQVPAFAAGPAVSRDLTVGVLIGGLALLEIVLLAGPAFAVSARRRQRQLALVAANGGTPAHVRRIVLADGIVLGLAGAVVGIAAGIASAFATRPYIEEYIAHARAGGYRVFPVALAAIALLALVTGLLAALVPAFITARQNVVASLAGRRGVTKSRKRWIVVGIAMVGAGTALVFAGTFSVSAEAMLAGIVVGELGLVFCTPALVGLVAQVGRMLPLAPRVALRDAARNRASAAPAISAVMAAVAGSVALGLYFDSSRALQERQYHAEIPHGYAQAYLEQNVPGTDRGPVAAASEVESVLRRTLPVSEVLTLSTVVCAQPDPERRCGVQPMLARGQECPYNQILGVRELTSAEQRAARADRRCDDYSLTWDPRSTVVDDGTALAALTAASAEEVAEATAMLRAGGVVVRDPRFVDGGRVAFLVVSVTVRSDSKGTVVDGTKDDPVRVTFPAYLLTTGIPGSTIVSPGAVAQAGLGSQVTTLIATTWREPTVAEEDRLARQLAAIRTYGYVERGPRLETDARVWILMAASALITLSAAAIGTGLAAADGRADLSTLAAVGASPRLRRGLSLSQSGVIAGLGSLLGALAGLGAAVAILMALNQQYVDVWPGPPLLPIAVPWLSLLMALVVVPFVAILGAGLFTRSRLPIERRV